jgi:hypothetical protein
MQNLYILINDPALLNGIVGVYTSGKKLSDAVANLMPLYRNNCLVKVVPANTWCGDVAGHDRLGVWLNDFLATPAASDDTGN